MKKLLFFLLFAFSCESPEVGGDGCCWTCQVKTTYNYPHSWPSEISVNAKYDSMFCDCDEEYVLDWEQTNTYSDTIDGIWTVQIAKCKR